MRSIRVVSTLLITSLGLAGCSTVNPYTGEQQTAKATTGTAIGAAAGALVGVLSSSKHDRGKGALIGAAAGAAVGGGVGYYMDQQEAKLRQQMQGTGVSVTRQGDQILLNMPNSITFDSSSSQLKPAGANALTGVAQVLKEYPETQVNVVGHTDSTGGREMNMRLSQQRAESVGSALILQGVAQGRISMAGVGPDQPVASNETVEGRAQNRRVTLTLSAQ
ncbi:OmpA family lipoprotein [Pseudaeromonas paramecii]|uniref:OmpA family lipoprotein n=1 Tax=Pseudaeromonas paramecii TaxID=2138166 RepID=A0ABP8QHJ7_9GAMM